MNQLSQQITVTSPLLPPLEEFIPYLQQIWDSKWITNNGQYHKQLEAALRDYLKVPQVSLFTNGTLPLLTALQALRITGEVITTPYSFVATTHSIWWAGCKPVFVDIDPRTGNLDPEKIEAAITPRTTAIMPVHCYGKPCDVRRIKEIADTYGLKVIYDAAHAFGVRRNGVSSARFGLASMFSFHATKVFNTIEGGALCFKDDSLVQVLNDLKNFGIRGQEEIAYVGGNAKMNEFQAAMGICNLRHIEEEIEKRTYEALDILHLRGQEHKKTHELSGGQKQRVALCRALVKQSPFFFLDEPLSNLDAQLRQKARTELVKIHEMFRPTMVYVTHDQIEAMTVADRIAVMNKGKVQQIDTPDTIYHHPANVFVATFIGSPAMNVVKARIEGTKIVIGECAVEIPAEWLKIVGTRKEVIFGLRPEAAKPNFDNAMVKGTVDFMENTGNLKTASLTLADGQNFFIQDSNQNIDLRNVTGFDFDWANVNLFDVETEENIGYVEA